MGEDPRVPGTVAGGDNSPATHKKDGIRNPQSALRVPYSAEEVR